jgi:excisionase family DNA binding protein
MVDAGAKLRGSALSVAEVAGVLNVSKMTVYRHIQSGRLDAAREDGSYRVSAQSLRRILELTSRTDQVPLAQSM